jgi:hypothetical protein
MIRSHKEKSTMITIKLDFGCFLPPFGAYRWLVSVFRVDSIHKAMGNYLPFD